MKRIDTLLLAGFALLALPACLGWSLSEPRVAMAKSPPPPALFPRGAPAGRGEDTFDRNTLARYTGYTDGGEHWRVLGGSLVGTGPAVQSVLVRNGREMADGWVEAVSPRADDGGLVLRFASPRDYYLLAFRDDAAPPPRGEHNLALYHHVGTAYHELWHADVRWRRGTTHTVRFEARGPRLRAYFDGALAGEVTPSPAANDPAPSEAPGGFGVRSYGADTGWVNKFAVFRWRGRAPARRG
jgi:hypothetical protein